MTKTTLQSILDDWNRRMMEGLEERLGIVPLAGLVPLSTRVYPMLPSDRRGHCGIHSGDSLFPAEITRIDGSAVAVGAVLDDGKLAPRDDLDKPVIVAVGINYTQLPPAAPSVSSLPAGWHDNTSMRGNLSSVFRILDAKGGMHDSIESCIPEFHLVVVNFFPWLTRREWGSLDLNAIAEALTLRCWGYDDPAAKVSRLIEKIARWNPGSAECVGDVPFVVFHGANNAVPYLGLEVVRHLCGKVHANFVICDNLSRPPQKNAVLLLPHVPLRLLQSKVHAVADD